MLYRPAQSKDYDPNQYLRDSDNRFVFDAESGIYKPKSCEKEKKRQKFKILSLTLFEWGTLALGAATLVFLIKYTNYARLQWCEAQRTANAAIHANELAQQALDNAKAQFRTDQRPYITLAPAGDVGKIGVVAEGEHAGHLAVEVHLENYGRSPGIEMARDARIAIGSKAAKRIRLHEATDRRGRIIPPGDRPSIYAYSDELVDQQMFNEIRTSKLLVIVYGHVEYTDMLGEPRLRYMSEFCGAVASNPNDTGEADDDCKAHTRME